MPEVIIVKLTEDNNQEQRRYDVVIDIFGALLMSIFYFNCSFGLVLVIIGLSCSLFGDCAP